jgi:glycosyltransferase involved in cell wall biosynthesis
MKVLHIFDHFLPMNLPSIYNIMLQLDRHGFDSWVMCMKRVNESVFPYEKCFAFHSLNQIRKNIIRVKALIKGKSFGSEYFLSKATKLRPSIVHSHFYWTVSDGLEIKRRISCPLILTIYGEDSLKGKITSEQMAVIRSKLNQVDLIICVSEYMKRSLLRIEDLQSPIEVLRLGVDTGYFAPKPKVKNNRQLVIGSAARFVDVKGLDILISDFSEISKEIPNSILKIAGTGPAEQQLKDLVARKQLTDKVQFVGWVPYSEMPNFYNEIDIFALANRDLESTGGEALSMALVEAQACGVPAVAFDSGGVPEVIENEVTGLVCKGDDSNSFKDAILRLLYDEDTRKRMGCEARRRIETIFSLQNYLNNLISIYDEVSNKKSCTK